MQAIETDVFSAWLKGLRDPKTRARIIVRLKRLLDGNAGDAKPIGGGLSELRLDFGPGYRVYFGQHGDALIILLAGGDKRSQDKDIKKAHALWAAWKEEQDGEGAQED